MVCTGLSCVMLMVRVMVMRHLVLVLVMVQVKLLVRLRGSQARVTCDSSIVKRATKGTHDSHPLGDDGDVA